MSSPPAVGAQDFSTPLSGDPEQPEVGAATLRARARDRHRSDGATIDTLKNVSAALIRSTFPRKAVMYVSEGLTTVTIDTFDTFGTDNEIAQAEEWQPPAS